MMIVCFFCTASTAIVASFSREWADLSTVSRSPSEIRALLDRFANVSSVAVVGSSGNLLRRGYGPLIDAHGVVVRVNGAVTRGYEHDCGRRHDIVVGWHRGLQDAVERHVLEPQGFQVVTSTAWSREGHTPSDASKLVMSTIFMHEAHKLLRRRWGSPSTGWLAIAFAMAFAFHTNATVSLFGFGACVTCNKYFDCDGSNSTDRGSRKDEMHGRDGYHPFRAEARLRRQWSHGAFLRLYEDPC